MRAPTITPGTSETGGSEIPSPTRNTARRQADRARLARLNSPCHICGRAIDYTLRWPDPMCFVADHVNPLARGGKDDITNKLAAHKVCNERKGKKQHANIIRRSGALD